MLKRKAGEEPQARAARLLLRGRRCSASPLPLRVLPPAVTSAPVLSALRRAHLPQAAGAGTKKEQRTLLTEQDVVPSLKGACYRCVDCAACSHLLCARAAACTRTQHARFRYLHPRCCTCRSVCCPVCIAADAHSLVRACAGKYIDLYWPDPPLNGWWVALVKSFNARNNKVKLYYHHGDDQEGEEEEIDVMEVVRSGHVSYHAEGLKCRNTVGPQRVRASGGAKRPRPAPRPTTACDAVSYSSAFTPCVPTSSCALWRVARARQRTARKAQSGEQQAQRKRCGLSARRAAAK